MSYLRCINDECREVVDLDGTPLGSLLDRAEEGCQECGAEVLGIFAGSPSDHPVPLERGGVAT